MCFQVLSRKKYTGSLSALSLPGLGGLERSNRDQLERLLDQLEGLLEWYIW